MSETEEFPGANGRGIRTLVVWTLVNAVMAAVLGIFLAVVLVLLQLIFYKAGSQRALVWGVIAVVLMTGTRFFAYRFLLEGTPAVMTFDIVMPIVSVVALWLLNLRVQGHAMAAWIRVATVYAFIALVLTPATIQTFTDPAFKTMLSTVFSAMESSFGLEAGKGTLMAFSLDILIRTGALWLTLMVLFCWYAATRFQRRKPVQWYAALALANFRIAEYMVWPLLVGLAVFGAGRVGLVPPAVDMVVTIFTLGMVFLYFLQGLGIISTFFGRQRNPGMQKLGLPLVLAILFLAPVINLVLLAGIPLLGVLELWISMRPVTHDKKDTAVQGD